MRLSSFIFLLVFLPKLAMALSVESIDCAHPSPTTASCQIQLEGEVQPGDSLMISEVQDIDALYYGNTKLGATGTFAGRKFYAAYIPRVYPLDLLEKKVSPKLTLQIESVFSKNARIAKGAQIKIVSALTPLSKILIRPVALFFEFIVLFSLSLFVFYGLKRGVIDGWNYPRHELRAFSVSTFLYLLIHTEFMRSAAPWLISKDYYIFLSQISAAVMMWSTSRLLLVGKFVDRSCVERGMGKRVPEVFLILSNFALLVPLCAFTTKINSLYLFSLLFLSSITSLYASIKSLEWRRVLKRSSLGPIMFHVSILVLALGLPLTEILKFTGNSGQEFAKGLAAFCLFTATWRVLRFQKAKLRSLEIVEELRSKLGKFYRGEDRLQILCEILEQEWGFSRVSLISVQEGQGLVLASSGPDAIPMIHRHHPQKLGPFLRRVCKEGHMLYAPVAEELGKDLQDKGLKHSSLGIPLLQENRVVAVLCVMADEDERIPPYDAMMIEQVIQSIRLEIVSAVLQGIAEERNERIISVARITGGLVLEHIDSWGRLHHPKEPMQRAVVAANIFGGSQAFSEICQTSTLKHIHAAYRNELRAIWFSLRTQFEFLSKDIRADDFWAISPGEFKQPCLRHLGQEAAALLLAHLLEKHARNLSLRADYLALGLSGACVATTTANLRFVPLGKEDVFGMDLDAADLTKLEKIRQQARPGQILTDLAIPNIQGLKIRSAHNVQAKEKQIVSILSISVDMKDVRKIEFSAIEFSKDRKKAA